LKPAAAARVGVVLCAIGIAGLILTRLAAFGLVMRPGAFRAGLPPIAAPRAHRGYGGPGRTL
jgi:hypothetical protein